MPEFPDLDPNDDHTPESLEQTLHEYARAVREEFELTQNGTDTTDNVVEYSEQFARENIANNLAQLQWLAQNSTSDGVRASCSKYLVELARKDAEKDGDPVKALMKKLTKQSSGTSN